ncbi:glycosyltransferase [uncultured Psychroserpens sp.]|uniref:glycosyltransferase n=1 Tax=uncultured Psychroserpens sp. TaxID=255436 RepID=UPI0026183A50|nr:glycosyltransferase [uncultured Psychroserpens sp.]
MLLSVRLQCYNHAMYLEQALQSICSQNTNFPFEVVIGDDFSTDDSIAIIKKTIAKNTNSNISFCLLERTPGDDYYTQRKAKGRLYNFLDIVHQCQGKYIALLDGDDFWTDPLKLQKQVDFLEANHDVSISFHKAEMLINGKIQPHKIDKEFLNTPFGYIELLKHHNFIISASVVFRKPDNFMLPDWFCDVPFGDLALYKLISQSGKIMGLNTSMCVYRVHDKGLYSGISKIQTRRSFVAFYNTIFPFLNTQEKTVVTSKIKATLLEIAKLKYPKNRVLRVLYYLYIRLKL